MTIPDLRTGLGWDTHRLIAGRPLILGGVPFEHDAGPVSHSDGDALLHAVTDAVLGALSLPDIGELFPDTDPAHESRDSAAFLQEAARRMRRLGWRVGNVDCTIILERPKVAPHKAAMRQNVARLLGADPGSVNIKGKTHEKTDAVGEGRAVEVHVVALLVRDPAP